MIAQDLQNGNKKIIPFIFSNINSLTEFLQKSIERKKMRTLALFKGGKCDR